MPSSASVAAENTSRASTRRKPAPMPAPTAPPAAPMRPSRNVATPRRRRSSVPCSLSCVPASCMPPANALLAAPARIAPVTVVVAPAVATARAAAIETSTVIMPCSAPAMVPSRKWK